MSAASLFGRRGKRAIDAIVRPGPGITLIGLDCDGTLAPLAARPEKARIPAATLAALRACAALPRVRVAILSARRVTELRRLAPVPRVKRIGLYGLLAGRVAPDLRARWRLAVRRLEREAEAAVGLVQGAWIEPKGMTLALHHRAVRRRSERRKLGKALQRLQRDAARLGFRAEHGRAVVEFVPREASKARTFRALLLQTGATRAAYFGDSEADDAVSHFLGRPRRGKLVAGLGVHVGREATRARYQVRGPSDVLRFLKLLARARSKAIAPRR